MTTPNHRREGASGDADRGGTGEGAPTFRARAKTGLIACALVLLSLMLLEGLSSAALLLYTVAAARRPYFPDLAHSRYDAELGWVNRPNLFLDSVYGPGIFIRTNAQGFRNAQNFPAEAPPGRLRVICSGDSFTFGYGVDNDHTWCQQLVAIDHRLETLNLGQSGYGLDQAFLRYRRDGSKLEHHVHILAFITEDFFRMRRKVFYWFGKPQLALRQGELVTVNVPVPQRRFASWWNRWAAPAVGELRTVQLMRAAAGRISGAGAQTAPDSATWATALAVFQALQATSATRGSTLVLVYLPVIRDYAGQESVPWRARLRAASDSMGIAYVDLVDALRRLDADSVGPLFQPPGQHPLRSPRLGHMTEQGNRWVAEELYRWLLAEPGISARLRAVR